MRNLEDLDIQTLRENLGWEVITSEIWDRMTKQFAGLEGWECPTIRIFQGETGVEMNFQTIREL